MPQIDLNPLKEEGIEKFFRYAVERHNIYLRRKRGEAWPWTGDPIMQEYRFCNVYRELDKTTVWFRENIRDKIDAQERMFTTILACVAFRWFNRIETWETLLHKGGRTVEDIFNNWDSNWVQEILLESGKAPYVTGSYIIKTPDGMNKVTGVLWCIDKFIEKYKGGELRIPPQPMTQEGLWEAISRSPFLGQFMSYEVVSDLAHTHVLRNAADLNTWANPGPGAARGYGRILGRGPSYLSRTSATDRDILIRGMQELLARSPEYGFDGKPDWPLWAMRECEHQLCEHDKILRIKNNEGRPRQIYRRPKCA